MSRADGSRAAAPTLAAAVVVRDAAGRVLLVREAHGRRRWGLPGGALEPGESPHQAVALGAERVHGSSPASRPPFRKPRP